MKLKEIAAKYALELTSHYNEDEAKAIFLLVIEHYLKINRSAYNLKKENKLIDKDLEILSSALNELKTGKPIQYILGETAFYGLHFKVNEAVLIPRPETEELVEWVIEKVENSTSAMGNCQPMALLDIGTGSGCIAISLKKNLPSVIVTALDVSKEALAVAKQNASLNHVDISFIHEDIFDTQNSILDNKYSIIISNPPYITQSEKNQMHQNVLEHEPHLALFVSNNDPLVFYEAIANFALKNLTENGLLFFEINSSLGKETVDMLFNKGLKKVELRKDMQGNDRMICCRKYSQ